MSDHLPTIGAVAIFALLVLFIYISVPLREYLLTKRLAAETGAQKTALDIMIALLDDAVKVAVLAVEQTMPALPPTLPDGSPTSPEAKEERNMEKLLQATQIVKKMIGGVAIAGTSTVIETSQIADRVEAAVRQMKQGRL